jgi:voltage-gated sodium channel
MHHAIENLPGWRGEIEKFMAHNWVQRFLIILIVVNAAIMGLETNPEVMAAAGSYLLLLDHAILWVFIGELVLLIAARRLLFFKDAWCVFDLLVVLIALVPATGSLSVLRALRVLRILRLINKVESMRTVVGALLGSLPGLGSVFGLILIIFYVSAVIATNMFGEAFPARFGSLSQSFYTLFQVMTLEGWSEEIARPVMEVFPSAWVFFILFILTATFIVVNLFVAVIVDSINSVKLAQVTELQGSTSSNDMQQIKDELNEMKALIQNLKQTLESR